MKHHITIFLSLGIGIISATMLVNRFLFRLPGWLAIVLTIIGAILIIYHLVLSSKNKKD